MSDDNSQEKLLLIQNVTGMSSDRDAILMLAYRGVGVQYHPQSKHAYVPLTTAIEWNKLEANDSSGKEREFRLALIGALESIPSNDQQFGYSPELVSLRNAAYGK